MNRIQVIQNAIRPRRLTLPDQKQAEGMEIGVQEFNGVSLFGQFHGIPLWSNQLDSFCSAGEEFAPSLEPSAALGAMKKAIWCVAVALKNEVGLENDYAQIRLKGLEI